MPDPIVFHAEIKVKDNSIAIILVNIDIHIVSVTRVTKDTSRK